MTCNAGYGKGRNIPSAIPRVNVECGRRMIKLGQVRSIGNSNPACSPHIFLILNRFFRILIAAMATDLNKAVPAYKSKGKEDYMNPRQLAHFRQILDEQKRELSQDIDRTVHTMQDEATIFADPNDRATQESDMSLELRNRDRERKLIKKIDETIALIDAGEYGYCEKCGVEIGLKRLEARPTASLCIDCKTLDELRERQVAK